MSCCGWEHRWDISPRFLHAEMHQTRPTVLWAVILRRKIVALQVPFPELATTSANGALLLPGASCPGALRPRPNGWPRAERGLALFTREPRSMEFSEVGRCFRPHGPLCLGRNPVLILATREVRDGGGEKRSARAILVLFLLASSPCELGKDTPYGGCALTPTASILTTL